MLAVMIRKCCAIKAGVVERDPKEQGERALLNLGHTIGHAVEKLMNFNLLHGQCVGIGLVAAAAISRERGLLTNAEYEQICHSLKLYDLPLYVEGLSPMDILAATKKDKKWNRDRLNLSLWMVLERLLLTRQLRIRSFLWEFTPSAGNLSWKIKQLQTTMIFH